VTRPLVAYVDDEPSLCRIFELHLRAETGWEVQTFTDPEAFLAFAAERPLSAVVCDYRMPTMNGLELLERLGQAVPFFLVSGDQSLSEAELDARVTGVVRKPHDYAALVETLRPHVG